MSETESEAVASESLSARIGLGWWVALAALVAPLLRSRFFLTQDGPTHLHNARILVDRIRGDWAPYADFYELNLALEPNWFTHGWLTMSLFVLPPWLSEKILLLAYVLIFALGFRYLARSIGGSPLVALLAVPFVYNVPFQMGFFNFSFSVAFLPWVVGWWWRNIDAWSGWHTAALSAVLLLLYFCHPVGLVFTGLALVLAWLGRGALGWDHLVHLALAGLPSLLLLLSFVGRHGGAEPGSELSFGTLVLMALTNSVLVILRNRELFIGVALALVMGVALVWGLVLRSRRGPRTGVSGCPIAVFSTLSVFALVLFFTMPDRVGSGLYLTMRLQLLAWLFLVPALTVMPWSRKAERVLAVAAIAITLAFTADRWSGYGIIAEDLDGYLSATEQLADGYVVLPLSFDHSGRLEKAPWSSAYVHSFTHAAHYAGAERPIIFLDNYEAGQGYFPLKWRAGFDPLEWMEDLSIEPPCVEPSAFEAGTGVPINVVLIWGLSESAERDPCAPAVLADVSDRPETVLYNGWMRVFGAVEAR